MLRLQCLGRPCIFGACYLELFLYTCQHTSFSEVIPDLLQELKVAFLLSGFDLKLHFFFDLHNFPQPQSSDFHLPSSSSRGKRSFSLTALLWQREGFKGDKSNPPAPQRHQKSHPLQRLAGKFPVSYNAPSYYCQDSNLHPQVSYRKTNMDLVTSDKFHLTQTLAPWVKNSLHSPHNQEHLVENILKPQMEFRPWLTVKRRTSKHPSRYLTDCNYGRFPENSTRRFVKIWHFHVRLLNFTLVLWWGAYVFIPQVILRSTGKSPGKNNSSQNAQ